MDDDDDDDDDDGSGGSHDVFLETWELNWAKISHDSEFIM
jgi:hypothetical protein